MHRELWIAAADDGDEVIFEGSDCIFGGVIAVQIWGHKLPLYFSDLKNCLMSSGHSLSRICIRGCRPLYFRYIWMDVIASSNSCAARDLIGSPIMELLSWS